jgi:glycosyltransferase involved in cell wall biosynthesis
LLTEKPDAILIFTDPRFFTWLFEIEDEIHQVCPILWWHVWDNYPYPAFNSPYYEATDALNCHSHMTYEMLKNTKFGEKTKFIPHAIPQSMFFPLGKDEISSYKKTLLGPDLEDAFVAIWVNRNAKRKRPNDVLLSWKIFVENNNSNRNQ